MSASRGWDLPSRVKLLVALAVGVVGGAAGGVLGAWWAAPLIGWDVLAVVFCVWIWAAIRGCDARATAEHARREDPGRESADLVLVGAALASLVAVGFFVFGTSHSHGGIKYLQATFATLSVAVTWILVHTLFTVKYARLYYADRVGGINFNQEESPQYSDFAYLAFTIGMTFQVSDTDLESPVIRRTALRHAWLSFPLGTVIIAATINLVAGLAK